MVRSCGNFVVCTVKSYTPESRFRSSYLGDLISSTFVGNGTWPVQMTKPPHNSINKKCLMLKISEKNDSSKERNIYDLCTFFFYHLGNAVMNIKTRTIMHYIYYPHYDFFVYVFVRGLHNKICQCPQYFRSKKKEKAIKLRTQFKRCYIGRTYRCHPTSQSLTCIMKQNNYNNEASISIQSVLEASPAA